jgi:hypothetical protein
MSKRRYWYDAVERACGFCTGLCESGLVSRVPLFEAPLLQLICPFLPQPLGNFITSIVDSNRSGNRLEDII